MNCPRCRQALEHVWVGELCVDVCRDGCGGIWFDRYELKQVDEPAEEAGELMDIMPNPDVHVDRSQRIHCPHCDDLVMMRHYFTSLHEVEVDECPGCAGFWLDFGELEHIRSLFPSEAEANAAARQAFKAEFADDLNAIATATRTEADRADRFADLISLAWLWKR